METQNLKPISIRRTLSVVASDSYDKKNIFLFVLLTLFISIFGILFQVYTQKVQDVFKSGMDKIPDVLPFLLLLLIVGLFFSFWNTGVMLFATNNAIHKDKNVFPNPFKSVVEYLFKGITFSFGFLVNLIIIFILTGLVMTPLIAINPVVAVVVSAIPCLFLTAILLGLHFNYLISLSFSDLFNYKKSLEFLKSARGYLGSFFVKSVILFIAYIVVCFGTILFLYMLIAVPVVLLTAKSNPYAIQILAVLMLFIYLIPSNILGSIFNVYLIELTGQFVKAALKRN